MTTRTVRLAVVLSVAALLTLSVTPTSGAQPAQLEPPPDSIAWLNLGDSYGAGEGASKATGHCQRSPNAGGPKAATILRDEAGWTIGPEHFAACTGAYAADIFSSRNELVNAGYDIYGSDVGAYPRDIEIDNDTSIYEWARAQGGNGQRYDVIVTSFGGNDVGFADIVSGCTDIVRALVNAGGFVASAAVKSPWTAFVIDVTTGAVADHLDEEGCGAVANELETRVDELLTQPRMPADDSARSQPGNLTDFYHSLADDLLTDDGVVVVLGYPRLMTPSSTWGRWRGGQCNMLTAADADRLGVAAEYFDDQLRQAIEGMGSEFEYISRFDVFDDGDNYHSLCGRGVEWLNTPLLFLRDGTARYQRGFHPNDLGYLATAEAVAGSVQSRLGVSPEPPPDETTPTTGRSSTTVTIRSSEAHFDIGEDFDAQCTIAWPTAPSRGVDSIQMRTFCPSVPDQFLFVDVVYGDPDLPVSPSRATMRVRGTIVDIIRSEYGFTVLAVAADDVDLSS